MNEKLSGLSHWQFLEKRKTERDIMTKKTEHICACVNVVKGTITFKGSICYISNTIFTDVS